MTLSEIKQWMAYYNLEPWGSCVDGDRHAVTASTVANLSLIFSDPKKGKRRPFKVEDFSVGGTSVINKMAHRAKRARKRQTWQEQRDLLNLFCRNKGKK